MDDSEKIDNLINLMYELKELAKTLEDPRQDIDITIGTIIALIICADVPDVTILPTNSITSEIAQA
jgi:hypothetical protein|tara:strand:+ start:281 stop:478 length:198 start_codon:yes stop_codon:yes gene_type:complete